MYRMHNKTNYPATNVSHLFQCRTVARVISATATLCVLICSTARPQLSPPNTSPVKWESISVPRWYLEWDDPNKDGNGLDSRVRRPRFGRNYYTLYSSEVQGKYGSSYSTDRWTYHGSTGEHRMWANASDLPPVGPGCGTRSETFNWMPEWTNADKDPSGRKYKYHQLQVEIKLYAPSHNWCVFQIKKQTSRTSTHLQLIATQKNNGSLSSGPGWALKSGMYGLATQGVWTRVNIVFDSRDSIGRSYVLVGGAGTASTSWTTGIRGSGDLDKRHSFRFGVYAQQCHAGDWGAPSSRGEARFRNVKLWKSL
jgi:hypothetical protein